MNVNLIVSATAVLVGLMVGLVFYLQSQSDDASYLVKSKWSVTTADGTAQTWLIDSESGAISISSVEEGTAIVEEFFGGKQYTYSTSTNEPVDFDQEAFCATHSENYEGDCAALASVHADTMNVMTESLAGTQKGSCTSEDSEAVSATISSSGNLNVGGFKVTMVNGSPSAILDHTGTTIATINSVEDIEEVKLTGCDYSEKETWLNAYANIADSRRKLGEVDAEVTKAREFLDAIMMSQMQPEAQEETRRHLNDDEFGSRHLAVAAASNTQGGGGGTGGPPGWEMGVLGKGVGLLNKYRFDPKNGNTFTKFTNRFCITAKNKFIMQQSGEPGRFNNNGMVGSSTSSGINTSGGGVQLGGSSGDAIAGPGRPGRMLAYDSSKGTPLCQGKGNIGYQRQLTMTNWCGAFSNRLNTPCPGGNGRWKWGASGLFGIWFYDYQTDRNCRRHDHGTRFKYIWAGVKLGCWIDSDLSEQSQHNIAVQMVFGKVSVLSMFWGCYDDRTATKFVQNPNGYGVAMRRKVTFQQEHTKYGPFRYNHCKYHHGYWIPFRNCVNDGLANPKSSLILSTAWTPYHVAPPNYWWEVNYDPNPIIPVGGTYCGAGKTCP